MTRTREAVLQAGRELLEAEGPEAVTHLRIGEATGIARTTIYRHWPDHESLLAAVLNDNSGEDDDGPDTGALVGDLHLYLDQMRAGPGGGGRRGRHGMAHGWAHVMARAEFDGTFADLRRQRIEGRLAPLRAILQRGVDRGELAADLDVDEAAIDFVAPVFFRRFFLGEVLTDERIDTLVDRFVAHHGA